jgi:diguanylate cyclase (GGDEF)-like protein/PAS domain S-box-containing protein
MTPGKPSLTLDSNQEVAALIEALHLAAQRLEDLTAGEVDTVADRDGRTYLLRHAQEYMRRNEAAKQAAILNALPANIALLDTQGMIISVNEAWRRFGRAHAIQGPGYVIGVNYLEVCDSARGGDASGVQQAAKGIRSVLDGEVKNFSMEYPCHSPTEQRWFLMTVTPLADDHLNGVVVMHLNITERRRTEEALHESAQKLRAIFEGALDGILVEDVASGKFLTGNPAICSMLGYTQEEIVHIGISDIHQKQDLPHVTDQVEKILRGDIQISSDIRVMRKDGSVFYADIKASSIRLGGKDYLLGIFRDTTERRQAEQELRESERRFSDMLENVELISVMLDRKARITYCNEYLLRLTDWRREEVIGQDWFELFVPPELHDLKEGLFAALLTNLPDTWHHDNDILTRSGEHRLIHWNNSVLRSGAGDVIGTASIGEDITERKQAADRIVYLNRVYAMLLGINTLIIRVRDRDEIFREACRVAVEEGGFRMAMIGIVDRGTMRIIPIATAGKDEEMVTDIKSILSSVELASTTMVSRAISEKKPIISNNSLSDPQVLFGKKYAECGVRSIVILPLIVSDVAVGVLALYASEIEFFREEELKLLTEMAGDIAFGIDHIDKQERLNYLAYYDELTGLANRSLFLDRVNQHLKGAASGGHKLALFLIDLERFKSINDSLGRPAGDALLIQVAEWLKHNAGDANLVARVSADHFAAVLPEVKLEGDVARLLEKTMKAFLDHPFHLHDAVFRIAVKVGVAIFPDDGANTDTLFKNAEAALKKAKASGERYLFYTQKMTNTVAGKLTLENQLRQALDNEEFVLHYQPKVNMVSGKLTSAEALIRWNDPRTGLVPPDRFIPILEETGLINDVGRWALHKAIDDYLRWRNAGLAAVRIAVNVSPLQLRNRGFIDEIKQAIGTDTHAAAGLELEITESLIMSDIKHSIASLQAIRAMGVSIAIDDFGTGFSSLSYLSRLPVDTLKIDRSFVIDMTAGPDGLALVATIINLAHSLKINVVAEGVETDEQLRLLRLLGCDEMQGYLFSQPVPSEIFETRFLASLPAGDK